MSRDVGNEIRELASSLSADYFGIADLAPARAFIATQGGERAVRFPRGVVNDKLPLILGK